ncbi:DUF4402 domain-containing protein [Brevundimonas guildfordensis]|uniref:DUF4402 domain-containing protein n=1 Tax=Brevundimonas guildfordensis TaxID=2762241 RepID=A0ABR8R198_9CAUL|nr:DUF4402 domain-containing protein [Brevundimonas guildfordensis]MBD7941580.1 DUF4402 domain-containing protein [Brevundimonas guildfordensis]
MNKTLIAAAAVVAFTAVAAPALAQSASTTGSGSITVIRPLTITKTADLKFGTVVRPSTGAGSVAVSAAGARSVAGGVVGLSSGDTPAAAAFTVAGEGGQSVSVTIPATFSMANGSDTLTVTTSNSLTGSAASQTLSNALGSAGSLAFTVGGSVPVASTTATGAYTGSFTVSAAYN